MRLTHPYTLTRHQWRTLFSQARTIAKLASGTMPRHQAMDIALEMAHVWGAIPLMTSYCGECVQNGWSITLGNAMYRTPRYACPLEERLSMFKADKRRQQELASQPIPEMSLSDTLDVLYHEGY